jgi:ABC-type cobalamin transport system permease subunit
MTSDHEIAVVLVPAAFAVAGALVYAFAANPKLANVGLVTYGCGLFWTIADVAKAMLTL